MNTAELKKLAEAATPGQWHIVRNRTLASIIKEIGPVSADSYCDSTWLDCSENDAAFIAAANPAAILKLLAINAELVEALKACMAGCEFSSIGGDSPTWHQKQMPSNDALNKARAALAKAEGGEL